MKSLSFFIMAIIITSCNFYSLPEKESPLARVYDKSLYLSKVNNIFPSLITKDDSILILENYVNKWIIDELVLYKAELNLSKNKKELEEELTDYKNSLIRFAYKQKLIDEYLDTLVTNEEISNYYSANKKNFELKENIIQAIYMELDKKSPKLNNVKLWSSLKEDDDLPQLKQYALQYAKNYYLDDTSWIKFEDISSLIPANAPNSISFFQNNKFIQTEDSNSIYLLRIIDYKMKNSNSPIGYVRNTIKSIILNRRKQDLVTNMQQRLYNDAINNNNLEIY